MVLNLEVLVPIVLQERMTNPLKKGNYFINVTEKTTAGYKTFISFWHWNPEGSSGRQAYDQVLAHCPGFPLG